MKCFTPRSTRGRALHNTARTGGQGSASPRGAAGAPAAVGASTLPLDQRPDTSTATPPRMVAWRAGEGRTGTRWASSGRGSFRNSFFCVEYLPTTCCIVKASLMFCCNIFDHSRMLYINYCGNLRRHTPYLFFSFLFLSCFSSPFECKHICLFLQEFSRELDGFEVGLGRSQLGPSSRGSLPPGAAAAAAATAGPVHGATGAWPLDTGR